MKKKLLMLLVLGLTLGACASSDSPDSADSISPVPPVESPEDGGNDTETPDDDGSGDEDSGETTPTNPELEVQEGDEYTQPGDFTYTVENGVVIGSNEGGSAFKTTNSGKQISEILGTVEAHDGKYAVEAGEDGYVINNGILQDDAGGNGRGMYAKDGGVAINGEDGQILTTGDFIMRAESNGIVINLGMLESAEKDKTILFARGSGGDTTIDTTALNHGELTLSGGARGMTSESSNDAISRSVNYGNIILNGEDTSRGMSAKGVGAIVENRGIITVNGDGNRGMYVESGASAYNYGTIDLTNSTNGRGIYADGKNTGLDTFVHNFGEIILNGATEADTANGGFKDGFGNQQFEMKNGAVLKNNGTLIIK